VSGYVRPRLTDKQARVLELLIDMRVAGGVSRSEEGMLTRAQDAIYRAFEQREERRKLWRLRVEASSRRGLLARRFRQRAGRPW
jgi:hypothetical protein